MVKCQVLLPAENSIFALNGWFMHTQSHINRVHEGERSMDFLSRLELDVPDTDHLESPPTRYESESMRYSKHA